MPPGGFRDASEMRTRESRGEVEWRGGSRTDVAHRKNLPSPSLRQTILKATRSRKQGRKEAQESRWWRRQRRREKGGRAASYKTSLSRASNERRADKKKSRTQTTKRIGNGERVLHGVGFTSLSEARDKLSFVSCRSRETKKRLFC